jgi:hypothetical protein
MKKQTYPANAVFLDLAHQWKASYQMLDKYASPARETDMHALAAMLVALENPRRLSGECLQLATACEELGAKRYYPWVDSTPWRISLEAMGDWSDGQMSVDVLCDHLDASRSALRGWALEVAWFVRTKLETSEALPKLLGNVADTLAFVAESWGLAGALFENEASFKLEAGCFEPESYADQYEQRREHFTKLGVLACQAHFWKLEAKCREMISDSMRRIYYPQIELEL